MQLLRVVAPAEAVVVPMEQGVQGGRGTVALPCADHVPMAHGSQLGPPKLARHTACIRGRRLCTRDGHLRVDGGRRHQSEEMAALLSPVQLSAPAAPVLAVVVPDGHAEQAGCESWAEPPAVHEPWLHTVQLEPP